MRLRGGGWAPAKTDGTLSYPGLETAHSQWSSAGPLFAATLGRIGIPVNPASFVGMLPESIVFRGKNVPIRSCPSDVIDLLTPAIVLSVDGSQRPWDGVSPPGTMGLSLVWPRLINMGLAIAKALQISSNGSGDLALGALEEAIKQAPDLVEILKEGVKILKGEVTKLLNPKTAFRREGYAIASKMWKARIIAKQEEIDSEVRRLRILQKEMGSLLAQRNAALKSLDPQHEVTRTTVEEQLSGLGITGLSLTPAGDLLESQATDALAPAESAASRVAALFGSE
jgi:hypothetical protein